MAVLSVYFMCENWVYEVYTCSLHLKIISTVTIPWRTARKPETHCNVFMFSCRNDYIDALDKYDWTALLSAINLNMPKTVDALLKSGAGTLILLLSGCMVLKLGTKLASNAKKNRYKS